MYSARLLVASLVAALSLVSNSVEGVMASMLISPIGGPLTDLSRALVGGELNAASSSLVAVVGSIVVAALVGTGVRVWEGNSEVTEEMRKRMGPIRARNMIVFATVIGMLTSLSALHSKGAGTLEQVGLAIAISILPPAVNAGVLVADLLMRKSGVRQVSRKHKHTRQWLQSGAVNSLMVSALNMSGVVAGGVAMVALWPKRHI